MKIWLYMYFERCGMEIILPYSLDTKMDGEIKKKIQKYKKR